MDPTSSSWMPAPLAWLVAVAVVVVAAATADWRRLSDGDDAHRVWGLATAIAVLWHADPTAAAGLHLLGATAACALLGLRIALVALAAGSGLQHFADGVDAWPVAFLAGAALPAAIAHAGLAWAVRGRERFGPLPWVAGAFAAGAASMAASIVLRAWVGGGTGVPTGVLPDASTAFALPLAMAFAEAQLSAGVVATVAAQRPHWLASPGARARRRPREAVPRIRR